MWKENVWVTTSGLFGMVAFECLCKTMPFAHILYSIDYPYSSNVAGLGFVRQLERSKILSKEQLIDFVHGNAARLLKIKPIQPS